MKGIAKLKLPLVASRASLRFRQESWRRVMPGALRGPVVDRQGFTVVPGRSGAVVRVESARQRSPGEMAADLVGLRRALRVLLGRGGAQEAAGGCEGVRLLECGRVQGALWKSERRHRASSCRVTPSPRCTEGPFSLFL